ncbi:MAG TPA: hypothetical protein VFY48_07425 [Solirubrobacterales bacterium]|nr:hypothetical protein [Solirubrobacterales bacterium]
MAENPRKRKQRSSGAERMARGYAKAEQRNQEAREALEPLAAGERPTVVTLGAVVAGLIALSIVAGYVAGVEVDGEKPRFAQAAAPALIMGVMAWGMWRARYWAVLGFEAIMAILMVGSVITLIAATDAFKAITSALVLVGAGTLFWLTVKALARIQMPEPSRR